MAFFKDYSGNVKGVCVPSRKRKIDDCDLKDDVTKSCEPSSKEPKLSHVANSSNPLLTGWEQRNAKSSRELVDKRRPLKEINSDSFVLRQDVSKKNKDKTKSHTSRSSTNVSKRSIRPESGIQKDFNKATVKTEKCIQKVGTSEQNKYPMERKCLIDQLIELAPDVYSHDDQPLKKLCPSRNVNTKEMSSDTHKQAKSLSCLTLEQKTFIDSLFEDTPTKPCNDTHHTEIDLTTQEDDSDCYIYEPDVKLEGNPPLDMLEDKGSTMTSTTKVSSTRMDLLFQELFVDDDSCPDTVVPERTQDGAREMSLKNKSHDTSKSTRKTSEKKKQSRPEKTFDQRVFIDSLFEDTPTDSNKDIDKNDTISIFGGDSRLEKKEKTDISQPSTLTSHDKIVSRERKSLIELMAELKPKMDAILEKRNKKKNQALSSNSAVERVSEKSSLKCQRPTNNPTKKGFEHTGRKLENLCVNLRSILHQTLSKKDCVTDKPVIKKCLLSKKQVTREISHPKNSHQTNGVSQGQKLQEIQCFNVDPVQDLNDSPVIHNVSSRGSSSMAEINNAENMIRTNNFKKSFSTFKIPKKSKQM